MTRPHTEIRVSRCPSRTSSVSPGRMAGGTFSTLGRMGRIGPGVSPMPAVRRRSLRPERKARRAPRTWYASDEQRSDERKARRAPRTWYASDEQRSDRGAGPSCAGDVDAVHTLGLRLRGDGAPRGTRDDVGGVDDHLPILDVHPETVEAPRGGAGPVLAVDRVLRAVARALEPLRRVAERDAAAQVHALAVEGDEARLRHVGLLVGGELVGGRRLALVDHEVAAPGG